MTVWGAPGIIREMKHLGHLGILALKSALEGGGAILDVSDPLFLAACLKGVHEGPKGAVLLGSSRRPQRGRVVREVTRPANGCDVWERSAREKRARCVRTIEGLE